MQATIQSTFTATSSAPPTQTDPKESIMKSRHFTYLWNTAAALLLVLCFNVVSAFGQTVISVPGPSVPGNFGNALSFDGVSGGVVLPGRVQWNLGHPAN